MSRCRAMESAAAGRPIPCRLGPTVRVSHSRAASRNRSSFRFLRASRRLRMACRRDTRAGRGSGSGATATTAWANLGAATGADGRTGRGSGSGSIATTAWANLGMATGADGRTGRGSGSGSIVTTGLTRSWAATGASAGEGRDRVSSPTKYRLAARKATCRASARPRPVTQTPSCTTSSAALIGSCLWGACLRFQAFRLDGGVRGAEGRLRVCRPSGVHRRFLPGRNQRFVRPGFP